jgi:hypothetical protein
VAVAPPLKLASLLQFRKSNIFGIETEMPRLMQFELYICNVFHTDGWCFTLRCGFSGETAQVWALPCAARSPSRESRRVMVMRRGLTTMREWISSALRY